MKNWIATYTHNGNQNITHVKADTRGKALIEFFWWFKESELFDDSFKLEIRIQEVQSACK